MSHDARHAVPTVPLRKIICTRTPGRQPGHARTAPFSLSTHSAAHGGPRDGATAQRAMCSCSACLLTACSAAAQYRPAAFSKGSPARRAAACNTGQLRALACPKHTSRDCSFSKRCYFVVDRQGHLHAEQPGVATVEHWSAVRHWSGTGRHCHCGTGRHCTALEQLYGTVHAGA